ncbi:MAG: hypothetical protein IT183_06060 [Acidobacteria bacterium]|nr:hypothetical protein [Acidobacteriota bacterium]
MTLGLGRQSLLRADGRTGYHVGERTDVPAEWLGTGGTLLVFLRSDCAASQANAGLLAGIQSDIPSNISVVAVVPARSGDEEIAFAARAGFDRGRIRTADFESLRLRVVPTLLLLDREGIVQLERIGTPQTTGQAELASELSRLASTL